MSHRKSQKHYEQRLSAWEKKQLEKDIANYIIKEYSLYCKEGGDKVWHPETEKKVKEMLILNSQDGGVQNSFLNHDFGEVLNRFGV